VRNRAENVTKWTIEELITILLRQFKRLLAEHAVELTEVEIKALAHNAAAHTLSDEHAEPVRAAIREIVAESLDVLAQWGMSYAQSLRTRMDEMSGWETTADFLTLANEKGNAELRISAGASLLACLGDPIYADKLWDVYRHGITDPEDVDAIIAHRALSFAAGIDEKARAWPAQISAWLDDLADGHPT
jgi:hypothetical protein